jgi:hypothetical protein
VATPILLHTLTNRRASPARIPRALRQDPSRGGAACRAPRGAATRRQPGGNRRPPGPTPAPRRRASTDRAGAGGRPRKPSPAPREAGARPSRTPRHRRRGRP